MSRRISLISCPICGWTMWCLRKSLALHAEQKHRLPLEEYLQECGGVEWFLAQREKNSKRMDTKSLACFMPRCKVSVEGVWAMSEHLRAEHRKVRGMRLNKMMQRLAKQMKLKKCRDCSTETPAFLSEEDYAKHVRHNHSDSTVGGSDEELRQLVFPEDEGDCKTSISHGGNFSNYCDCEGDSNQLDGCTYFCPKKCQGEFKSLAQITGHVIKCHGGDLECFKKLKELRRVIYIKCQYCDKNVIHDRMEMGHHLWKQHGIAIEAYDLYKNPT